MADEETLAVGTAGILPRSHARRSASRIRNTRHLSSVAGQGSAQKKHRSYGWETEVIAIVRHEDVADSRTLTPEEARAFYDRFGRRQDSQAFYEAPALDALVANCDFQSAESVFEFGCGTGRFALELLQHRLAKGCVYHGVDISTTMVGIARTRLAPFAARATVSTAGERPIIPMPDACVDRVICTYVLDLLPQPAVAQLLAEARRVLRRNGRLCLTGITHGVDPMSRTVMGAWQWIFARHPAWVGGCRPTHLADHLSGPDWRICFHDVVVAWGIASEVLVASPLAAPGDAGETGA